MIAKHGPRRDGRHPPMQAIEAEGTAKDSSGNGTASINITASEDVNINWHEENSVIATAETRNDSGSALANINIGAGGSVNIDDKVRAYADAHDSEDATAGIVINADTDVDGDGSVNIDDDVEAYATASDGS